MIAAPGMVAPEGSSTSTVRRRSCAEASANKSKNATRATTTVKRRIEWTYDARTGGFTSAGTISCNGAAAPGLYVQQRTRGTASMATLGDVLATRTRAGDVYERLDRDWVRCHACGHDCRIPQAPWASAKCASIEGGQLRVPWGYVGGVQCDPIEKKPFFHALPGRARLQLRHARLRSALRLLPELGDLAGAARSGWRSRRRATSTRRRSCDDAVRLGARVIVSTYNEPLITSEWAVAVFKEATRRGARTGFVSNGNGTPQVLEYLRPWVDLYKVDLKSFDDRHYRQLGGRLQPILDTIRAAARAWLLARNRHAAHPGLQRLATTSSRG